MNLLKYIPIAIFIFSAGCSATFINRGSPLRLENACKYPHKAIPFADVVGAGLTGTTAALADKNDLGEYQRTIIMTTSVIFAVSALMGYGEMIECKNEH